MFSSITGAISGLAGAHFGEAIKAGSWLAKGAMALIDGELSVATYIGQSFISGDISTISIVGIGVSLASGLFNFCDPLESMFDYFWSPVMGAEMSWVYDIICQAMSSKY